MRKLGDLYFDKRIGLGDLKVEDHKNVKEEDHGFISDLMNNNRVQSLVNNACKDVLSMSRGDKEVEIMSSSVNLGSTSIETKIHVKITLLKAEDKHDLCISLYSLVNAPQA